MFRHVLTTVLSGLFAFPVVVWAEDGEAISEASEHWSFQPICHPDPPNVRNSSWSRNELDRFVFNRLESEGVKPSPEAQPTTLLRRLYLDLAGLPPTPADVDAFLSDTSDRAYEHVVDRLLKSPHYGERWGRYWLDMARYADSNGYESDRVRPHAWRWRDWVIDALNADMPFDQFTIEQIAGDLLPNATLEQKVATGFHRNTLLNTEGGVDREEDRVKRTVDRTNTVGKVWLGITLGCCQCHSHKYDPISQREYYQFFAFFNSLIETDISTPLRRQLEHYERDLTAFEKEHQPYFDAIRGYRSETMTQWEKSLPTDGPLWHVLKPKQLSTIAGTTLTPEGSGAVFASGPNDKPDTYTFVATTTLTGIMAIRLEVLADGRLSNYGPGLASNGNFVLSSFRAFAAPAKSRRTGLPTSQGRDEDVSYQKGRRIALTGARADFSQNNRQVTSALVDDPDDGWAIHPKVGQNHTAVFELTEGIGDQGGTRLTMELDHQTHSDHNLGKFRISVTTAKRPVPIEVDIVRILGTPSSKRTARDLFQIIRFYDFKEDGLDRLIEMEAEHAKQAPPQPDTTAMAQTIAESKPPRETRVHLRGDFLNKGERVESGTPGILPYLTSRGERPDRLDVARWIISEENPLTARVIVNRIWQQYFGRGLVATDDDFGTQGDPPTHPELLDWLATRFREDGWSLKNLHKLIVMSATYRQSSRVRPELLERDPYNTWIARQNRLRVEAEIVRDLALSVSGLLNPAIGGPSVRPPQPADLVKLGFQENLTWQVSEGPNRYRRGLYTFFQRTVPYPMLVQFDAADSNTSCTRRERSTSPLQALTLWNDAVFVECSQAFGRRVVTDVPFTPDGPNAKSSVDERLRYAFRLGLARDPTVSELQVLERLLQQQQRRFEAAPEAARSYIGQLAVPEGTTVPELAGYVSVARLLINLDEFITRE